MSANWIKWCKGLAKKREVLVLASRFKRDRHEIAGRLMALWEWCDENMDDTDFNGEDAIMSLGDRDSVRQFIDGQTGIEGMTEALESPEVSWLLRGSDNRVVFKKLRRHNGKTAKERAAEQRKKAHQREAEKKNGKEPVPVASGPEQKQSRSRGRSNAAATALEIDRGVQGGKICGENFAAENFPTVVVPEGFLATVDRICQILGIYDRDDIEDQIPFLAKVAFAEASGFEFPVPIWDYVGRAKSTRRKVVPNPAGYLLTSLRGDLGPSWADFEVEYPSPEHCRWLMGELHAGKIQEGQA